ncbi:DNA repair and recombination protein RadB [Candidatus Pacearchaeota archaeon]|nr:DNA repair and recombination protein RadB [Candidatus Pacearchaeota archaeon]
MERGKISAGSYDLNKWLLGGYEKDIITTIYGSAGSGKTNFCLLAAVSQAKKGNKVIFIDTEGGFSTERLKQIAQDKTDEIMTRILLLKPTSFSEQQKSFNILLNELKGKKEIGVIIVDGITMLYRLELAEAARSSNKRQIQDINSKLANQMRILAEIARKEHIPIIVTNQVYSEFLSEEEFREGREKKIAMVGGDILKYWSKCIIELQNSEGRKKAILIKHRSLPQKELSFIITNTGILRTWRIF